MADETKQKHPDPDLDSEWEFDDDEAGGGASQRPTLAPPFDLASYAKEAMVPQGGPTNAAARPDEAKPVARVISLPPPPPLPNRPLLGRRPSAFPPRAPSTAPAPPSSPPRADPGGNSPTRPPLAQAPTPAFGTAAVFRTPLPPSEPLSQRITPRDMVALEAARTLSLRDAPPPSTDGGKPSSILALANHRAPLMTPEVVRAVALPATLRGEEAESASPAAVSSAQVGAADPVVEMQERFALGDYSGALVMAESMLEENPSHLEAREYAESCRSVLQQMYTARIGPLHRVPIVEVARDQLRWLSIDHRAGFILSLVDGVSSLEMILDVCGMTPLDALRTIYELVQQRIVSIQDD